MRNVWKGLVVGGLTGVAAGVLIDMLEGGLDRAANARDHLRERAPEWKERARHAAGVANERLREAELGDKARHAAEVAGERLREADLGEKARHAAEVARERAREVDLTELADKAKAAGRNLTD